ncbi:MAG: hypothetical protein Kow0089_19250 [Desulfobulbaceae bacterium]
MSDREINAIRLGMVELLKSLFALEPEKELIATWKEAVSAMAREQINPAMDRAADELNELLTSMEPESIAEERYILFTNPFSSNTVHTTLSYYRDGHDLGQSLVELRRFLLDAGIQKIGEFDESEDSLVFLLDTLATLIREEENHPEDARKFEGELLSRFMEPLSAHFVSALRENGKARFYQACAELLACYVDLEKELTV